MKTLLLSMALVGMLLTMAGCETLDGRVVQARRATGAGVGAQGRQTVGDGHIKSSPGSEAFEASYYPDRFVDRQRQSARNNI